MATSDQKAELLALKKRQREISAAIKQSSCKHAKHTKKRQLDLASLVHELGTASLGGSSDLRIPPDLAGHKDKMTLLVLFELSGHCADTVASWLLGHGFGRGRLCHDFVHMDPEARCTSVAGIEWLYIQSPVELVAASVDSAPFEEVYRLGRYAVEYHLFNWIVKQNCDHGVAPQNRQLFVEASKCVPLGMPGCVRERLCSFFLGDTRSLRRWAKEFRQRWGVKPGRMVPGETLEPEVLQNKVPWSGFGHMFGMWIIPCGMNYFLDEQTTSDLRGNN
jgi:hypothetical protein